MLRTFHPSRSTIFRPVLLTLAIGMAGAASTASAQELPPRHRLVLHAHRVANRVLTVHRREPRLARVPRYDEGRYAYEEGYGAPALVRRWNDPNLDSFGGWRLGGDNFYGDQAGDPITRGNAALGAIAGYGPANGGYGGPHFDSVGGFHNGPGPDAQEDADYASGSISTPDYGGIVAHYPSVKARVAALTTGALRSGALAHPARIAPAPVAYRPSDTAPYVRSEDLFPDLGIDAF